MTGMLAALVILGRRFAGPAWAVAAELAWHLAGQAWAFTVLAAGLGWLATRLPAAIVSATAKAYAVEARVDAIVPAVANAKGLANTAQSTASAAQSAANSAMSVANNALPRSGGTVSGNVEITGFLNVDGVLTAFSNFGVHGNTTMLGQVGVQDDVGVSGNLTATTLVSNGSTTAFGPIGVHGNAVFLGNLTADALISNGSTTVFGALGVHGNTTMLGTLNGHSP